MRKSVLFLFVTALLLSGCGNVKSELPENPNFLIFFVDDLRPELNCYGATHIHSPNIDALASEGMRFDRAYCNVPVCGASRASLLTGTRPTPTRFVTYHTWADEDLPDHVSLPGYFRQNGYYTVSFSKIFHHMPDSKESWSEPAWAPDAMYPGNWRDYIVKETVDSINSSDYKGPSVENPGPVHDTAYKDGKTAYAAVKKLQELAEKDQPFMFWVGLLKPHLPFNAPAKYWELYNREDIVLPEYMEKPVNAPDEAMHNFGELRGYSDIPPTGPVSDEKAKELIHGYYASTSYTDAMIGVVMDELKRLGLDKNTVVAVFGDHGWNLGEHGLWCKHCNFNTSLHVPLIMKIPGMTKGKSTAGLTEYVDLFPTFADLAGLPVPEWLDGKSLVPLIEKPAQEWNDPVFSRFIRGNSIVTEQYIYTDFQKTSTDTTIISNMLYDHEVDPDETVDVSEENAYSTVVEELAPLNRKVHFHQPEGQ